jgi:cell division protein FtsZ
MAEVLPEIQTFARIKVCGVGGGGTAAVERMIASKIQGIEFVAINTDAQSLHHSHASKKVHIGQSLTRGLGAGADPEVGRKAAEESIKDITEMLKGSDMVFITAGEGGGTGTGAAPVIAEAAKEAGALVVAIVTKPFTFEGERRRESAEQGIENLRDNVDTLITIPNDKLLDMIDRKTSLLDAFKVVDDVLQQGVQGISDLITVHGLINLDFADVKSIMEEAGSALMGIGRAKGDNRAVEAAKQAIDSPLLEVSIEGAKGVLFNITGGRNMSMHEIDEAAKTITEAVDPSANIIFGAVLDESMDDDIKITVVATGFDGTSHRIRRHEPKEEAVQEPVPPARRFMAGPFIDEPPAISPEQTHSLFEEPVNPRVSSIEPEVEEPTDIPAETVSSASSFIERASREAAPVEEEEDDLDIPAFIRRKKSR